MTERLRQSGNVFFTLFGAVALVGVVGASTMTIMKGPVKSMAEVTKRTVAENNMIASGKLALISASNQPSGGDCDSDGLVEPIPYSDTGAGPRITGGGYLPSSIGAAKQDPWGNDYGYCVWDHGSDGGTAGDNDANCGGSTKLLAGGDTNDKIVLAVVSSGPNRMFETTCGADPAYLTKPGSSDDVVLSYTYAEAGAASGGLWNLEDGDADTAEIAKNISVKDSGGDEQLGFDTATKALAVGAGGSGSFPTVKTDFIQQLAGGSVEFLSNIKLGTSYLSGDGGSEGISVAGNGNVTASHTLTAGALATGGTLNVTGASTLGAVGAGATSVTTLSSSGLATLHSLGVTNAVNVGTTLTMNAGNIILGSNYLSGDGGNEGIRVDSTGNVGINAIPGGVGLNVGGAIFSNNTITTSGASGGFTMNPRDGSGDQWVMYNATGDSLSFWRTTGGNAFSILQNGSFGIGTDSPAAKLHVDGTGKFTGTLDMSAQKILNLATPTANADAATKAYVDTAVAAGAGFVEQDPQVGMLTSTKWCNTDGTVINCTSDPPVGGGSNDNLGNHTATTTLDMNNNPITGAKGITVGNNTAAVGLSLRGLRTGTWSANRIDFGDELDNSRYFMNTRGTNEAATAPWRFYYHNTGTGSDRWETIMGVYPTALNAATYAVGLAENRLYIDSAGDVGINDSNPSHKLTVLGETRIDSSATYDVWLQGGSATSTQTRNLALLGRKSDDTLFLNHSSEYAGGTVIGGPVTINGTLNVTGGTTGGGDNLGAGGTTTGEITILNQWPIIKLVDTDHRGAMLHANDNSFYILTATAPNNGGWTINGSYWPLQIDTTTDAFNIGGAMYMREGNLNLGSNYLSGDGGNEGIRVDGNGSVTMSGGLNVTQGIGTAGSGAGFIANPRDGSGASWTMYNPTGDGLHFYNGSDKVMISATGEVISLAANQFRAIWGNYGTFIRNDGSNTYFLLTNSGDQYGTWNALRPLAYNNATGLVTMANGADMASTRINNVGTPVAAGDAATKGYVDGLAGGVSDYQTFTANGTWTKPAGVGANQMVIVEMWGGGGGGSSGYNASYGGGGGGGGSYRKLELRAGNLGATVTVTIGAGGGGGNSSVVSGGGGNSSFGTFGTAYGGGAGRLGVTGGGGLAGAGSVNGGPPNDGGVFGGGNHPINNGSSVYGGGGGGDYSSGSNGVGGLSVYGGGGGAGNGIFGGSSTYGGKGGDRGQIGNIPGGGGGGGNPGTVPGAGAAGARGEVRVWVVP